MQSSWYHFSHIKHCIQSSIGFPTGPHTYFSRHMGQSTYMVSSVDLLWIVSKCNDFLTDFLVWRLIKVIITFLSAILIFSYWILFIGVPVSSSDFWVLLFLVEIFITSIFGIGLIYVGDTFDQFLIYSFGVDKVMDILVSNDSELLASFVVILTEFSIGLLVTEAGANFTSPKLLGLKSHIPVFLNPLTALRVVAPFKYAGVKILAIS